MPGGGNRCGPVAYHVLGNAIDCRVELCLVGGRSRRGVYLIDGYAVKYRPVGKGGGDRGPVC